MPLICAHCIWVAAVLIWIMVICIYLCLLTFWMQKIWCPHQLQNCRCNPLRRCRANRRWMFHQYWASDPPPADDIAQCPVGSSAAGQPTAVAPIAPLATAGTTVPSIVDPAPTTHLYGTRLKHNIKKPKVRTHGTVTYSVVRSSATEPTSHITAMEHPLWRQAIIDEFHALLKNKTWHLVPPRAGLNVIDCKWVFKLKQKPDGSIDRYKARLVAKGFKQAV